MKSPSIPPVLAAAAAFIGMLLLAPIHPAAAGAANGATKATLGTKVTPGVRDHRGAVGKLQCIGSSCPRSGEGYKATTTGTYNPNPNPCGETKCRTQIQH